MSSKKDYIAIAAIINGTRPPVHVQTGTRGMSGDNYLLDTVARKLADVYAADNSEFNRSRFLTACGVQ
jgi:hypothetical protein